MPSSCKQALMEHTRTRKNDLSAIWLWFVWFVSAWFDLDVFNLEKISTGDALCCARSNLMAWVLLVHTHAPKNILGPSWPLFGWLWLGWLGPWFWARLWAGWLWIGRLGWLWIGWLWIDWLGIDNFSPEILGSGKHLLKACSLVRSSWIIEPGLDNDKGASSVVWFGPLVAPKFWARCNTLP